jgi:predicted dehydrogenase/threonine dehydrogenase-like Zn-dependent dehydrogenase
MKQLLQRFDSGEILLTEVPVPTAGGVQLVVQTRASVISSGTERALVEFSRSSLLDKARQQPDRVRDVINKARTDGVLPTLQAVRAKLSDPITLGYCNAGVVVEIGSGVRGFSVGDRVVSNAPHGEYARVPHTLAARIPPAVDFERAAFAPLAAIALQGIRLARPELGETVVVMGLGLVGLLTVQLLRASGCEVIGIDPDAARRDLAEGSGACALPPSGAIEHVLAATGGSGADAVLLTLASDSDDPVHQAAAMSRKRGRIVLVGVSGLRLRREDFYRKELTFQVSCSYGPGRYDPEYEEEGRDYPVGFVRWTEQRNFEAVLQFMADGRLDPLPLVTHRFAFEDAAAAYDLVTGAEPSLGIVLGYAAADASPPVASARTIILPRTTAGAASRGGAATAALIGAGNFARRTLLPAVKAAGFRIDTVASVGGITAAAVARDAGARTATTDVAAVLEDPGIGTVFIATRHDSHGQLAARALEAGKHVFVEKPLALSGEDINRLEDLVGSVPGLLTVGFNRRFAPLAVEFRRRLSHRPGPAALILTVNAGTVPPDHWTQDPVAGGGRIAGEACHFIDLARFLVGDRIVSCEVSVAKDSQGRNLDDVATMVIGFAEGSSAAIHYFASGSRSFPKERIEAFAGGETIAVENWRRLRHYGPSAKSIRSRRQDKGHGHELLAWRRAVCEGLEPPIPYFELFEVSRASLILAQAARAGGVTR